MDGCLIGSHSMFHTAVVVLHTALLSLHTEQFSLHTKLRAAHNSVFVMHDNSRLKYTKRKRKKFTLSFSTVLVNLLPHTRHLSSTVNKAGWVLNR